MQFFMHGVSLNAPNLRNPTKRDKRHSLKAYPLGHFDFPVQTPVAWKEAAISKGNEGQRVGRDTIFMDEFAVDEADMDPSVRILVMDDSPVIRSLIVAMLEDIVGVDEVIQVGDAPSAVEAVAHEPPLIAILDIKVPGDHRLRNGIDVLREIKRTNPATDVIMLTNHAIPLYRQTCIDAGASYFFDKSSEFDQLPEAIEEILNRDD